MLDPRMLATRREEVVRACQRRGARVDVDLAISRQERLAAAQTALQEANRLRNEHQAAGKRPLSQADRDAHTAEGRRLKEEVTRLEGELAAAQGALSEALLAIPNLVHPDVPDGGEEDFRVVRTWGEPTRFDFAPQDHLALGERLGLLDFEGGAKVAGQKWYFLRNEAVLLELALQRFALDLLIEDGFAPYLTPDVAKPEILDGIGYSPKGPETQIYSLAGHELCLIGTAEITLGGLFADTILDEEQLPLKLAGISHCFRTEAGAAGRESKGLYRVHQFSKVEMFAFTRPEDSEAMHAHLLSLEEKIFQALEIPYRVIDIAAGDLGAPAYRKFDLEAWMPGRGEHGAYGEVTSTSNCTDYQARRLGIRFRREGSKKTELVHTLNGTAVALSRTPIALLENHQRADGTIAIPKALRPYLGRESIGARG
ncbi:MAG TPA: serine--tRNA ligase [Myxococcota bacterium]|jgi:seryl-tRNA synthetase|nr:serine--tRNA ligase [Myxococcota bacterium]